MRVPALQHPHERTCRDVVQVSAATTRQCRQCSAQRPLHPVRIMIGEDEHAGTWYSVDAPRGGPQWCRGTTAPPPRVRCRAGSARAQRTSHSCVSCTCALAHGPGSSLRLSSAISEPQLRCNIIVHDRDSDELEDRSVQISRMPRGHIAAFT